MLIDDELSEIFSDLSPYVNLTIVCDACFSGGIDDMTANNKKAENSLLDKYLPVPPDLEHRNDPNSPTRAFGTCLTKKEGVQASVTNDLSRSKSLLIAACRETEKAAAGSPETNSLSVFSYFAIQALRSSPATITARQFVDRVADDIAKAGYSQVPQLKGRQDLFNLPVFR
jgi:hypothetical protein